MNGRRAQRNGRDTSGCLNGMQDTGFMSVHIKRIYFILLMPAVCGFLFVFAVEHYKGPLFTSPSLPEALVPLVFSLSVIFAAALPIWYRSFFASKVRHRKNTTEGEWVRFECTLLYIAMVTPYVALAAHILRLPRFHYAGTALMALYAIYYHYPSRRRISFDRRIFRVK